MADDNVTSLGDAAKEVLDQTSAEQDTLDGTNLAKVTFLGMGWDPADVPELKEEVEFVVKGQMVFEGEQVMADGSVRPVAKCKVDGVIRAKAGTFAKVKTDAAKTAK